MFKMKCNFKSVFNISREKLLILLEFTYKTIDEKYQPPSKNGYQTRV